MSKLSEIAMQFNEITIDKEDEEHNLRRMLIEYIIYANSIFNNSYFDNFINEFDIKLRSTDELIYIYKQMTMIETKINNKVKKLLKVKKIPINLLQF